MPKYKCAINAYHHAHNVKSRVRTNIYNELLCNSIRDLGSLHFIVKMCTKIKKIRQKVQITSHKYLSYLM